MPKREKRSCAECTSTDVAPDGDSSSILRSRKLK